MEVWGVASLVKLRGNRGRLISLGRGCDTHGLSQQDGRVLLDSFSTGGGHWGEKARVI